MQELEVAAISVITAHSDNKNTPTITRCDYPLGQQSDAIELSNELFSEGLSHYLMGDGISDGLTEYPEHHIMQHQSQQTPDTEGRVYQIPRNRQPV